MSFEPQTFQLSTVWSPGHPVGVVEGSARVKWEWGAFKCFYETCTLSNVFQYQSQYSHFNEIQGLPLLVLYMISTFLKIQIHSAIQQLRMRKKAGEEEELMNVMQTLSRRRQGTAQRSPLPATASHQQIQIRKKIQTQIQMQIQIQGESPGHRAGDVAGAMVSIRGRCRCSIRLFCLINRRHQPVTGVLDNTKSPC